MYGWSEIKIFFYLVCSSSTPLPLSVSQCQRTSKYSCGLLFSHNYVLQDDVLPFIIITGYPSTSKSSWGFIFTVNSILLLTQFRNSEHTEWWHQWRTELRAIFSNKSSVLFSWIPAHFRFLTSLCIYKSKAKYECWCNWKDCVHYPSELLQHKL